MFLGPGSTSFAVLLAEPIEVELSYVYIALKKMLALRLSLPLFYLYL